LKYSFVSPYPPLRLALRERYLRVRRRDPVAATVAAEELATVERIRARLVRHGWFSERPVDEDEDPLLRILEETPPP
jgi:hypothetical protein